MAAIYSNAYLTIAAAHARDSFAGCFNRRPRRRHLPISITAHDGTTRQLLAFLLPPKKEAFGPAHLELSREPLSQRAWALQERLMAQRVLHYCADQMSFECREEFVSEDGLRLSGRHCNLFQEVGMEDARRSQHSANHGLWYYLLRDYGGRKLSKPSDKLPAVSGLARLFESRMQASYVAGLWSDALVEGLVWKAAPRIMDSEALASQTYIAPSWSWASCNGFVWQEVIATLHNWREIARVLEYHIELKTQNPYGELKGGWIRIEAPLIPLSPNEPNKDEDKVLSQPYLRMKTAGGAPYGHLTFWDSIYVGDDTERDQRAFVNSLDHFALVVARFGETNREAGQQKGKDEEAEEEEAEDEDRNDVVEFDVCYWALLVVPTSSDSGQMRRVGMIHIDARISKDRKLFEDRSEFKTVVLV
jgi:hypothetical protein